jgi:hypothetical protein
MACDPEPQPLQQAMPDQSYVVPALLCMHHHAKYGSDHEDKSMQAQSSTLLSCMVAAHHEPHGLPQLECRHNRACGHNYAASAEQDQQQVAVASMAMHALRYGRLRCGASRKGCVAQRLGMCAGPGAP